MLEIKSLSITPGAKNLVMNLDQQDIVIFVSRNAVIKSIPVLEEYWPQWPLLSWFAVGRSTAQALENYGIKAAYPDKAGSEGLLALPGLREPEASRVMIVRGQGGRELLAEELVARGAAVSYFETYTRIGVDYGAGLVGDLYEENINICVVTSLEGLDQLLVSLNKSELGKLHLVVPSARIAVAAGNQGWAGVSEASGADDAALLQSILQALVIVESQ